MTPSDVYAAMKAIAPDEEFHVTGGSTEVHRGSIASSIFWIRHHDYVQEPENLGMVGFSDTIMMLYPTYNEACKGDPIRVPIDGEHRLIEFAEIFRHHALLSRIPRPPVLGPPDPHVLAVSEERAYEIYHKITKGLPLHEERMIWCDDRTTYCFFVRPLVMLYDDAQFGPSDAIGVIIIGAAEETLQYQGRTGRKEQAYWTCENARPISNMIISYVREDIETALSPERMAELQAAKEAGI